MAGDFEVNCIVKRGGHYNPHGASSLSETRAAGCFLKKR